MRKKLSKDYNLSTEFPEIAKEWNQEEISKKVSSLPKKIKKKYIKPTSLVFKTLHN